VCLVPECFEPIDFGFGVEPGAGSLRQLFHHEFNYPRRGTGFVKAWWTFSRRGICSGSGQRITHLLAVRDRLDDVIAIARAPDSDCSHMQ
jgi:hypothetical protein